METVKVVRCKNCVFWDVTWEPNVNYDPEEEYHYCPIIDRPTESNFFCSEGVTAKDYFKEEG